ncbi:hypothetical protein [Acidipila sp. EB88]|uniref:hypothetical protein n=1 Tax=Acidipila sp. EB88 TaxID=2305226 RepID=UPI000F5DE7F9|nr:hypothetical protein [Acidipila sp. EB88]
MELLTVNVTTLAERQGTRYRRAELNVKLPGLDSMTPEDVKKTIDTVVADPATASAVESKTIKLGMSPDEKKRLESRDKIAVHVHAMTSKRDVMGLGRRWVGFMLIGVGLMLLGASRQRWPEWSGFGVLSAGIVLTLSARFTGRLEA